MSAELLNILNDCSVPFETVNADGLELLEKCGEVFLERHLGNLIYVCNLCDDRFGGGDEFASHITDTHLSIENFIAYEPSESDAETCETTDPIGKSIQDQNQQFDMLIEESTIKDEEEDYLDIESNDDVQEKQIIDTDHQVKLNLKQGAEEKMELQDSNSFEITICEEKIALPDWTNSPEKTIIEEEEQADISDEEILRSKLMCKFCGEQFDYVKDMRQHDCGLNKKKKSHVCSVCGKLFKKKSGLDIHSLLHKGEKPHKCDICGTAYACKQNLIVHVRRHTGEKPFKCDYCERRFASSTEKISHMRTHTGDRPFVCELCGKGHSSASQLTEHMRRHLDIRNYVCEVCNKRFRNSYNLRMHRMTHDNGPRQYHCDQCKSTFRTHSNLLQHSRIHEKVKKYVCKICGRAFAQHPGLYSHMKSHVLPKQ